MTTENEQLQDAARLLKVDKANAKTAADRAAWNQRLQDHLTNVVAAHPDQALADAIESWCDAWGLYYLPEPTWTDFTKQVADDCDNYARRYRVSLADALDEWEGDGPRGGWGLSIEEAATVAAYFADQGRELSEIPEEKKS